MRRLNEAPGRRMSAALSMAARMRAVRVATSTRLSMAVISPSKLRSSTAGVLAVTGWPISIRPSSASGRSNSTRMRLRSSKLETLSSVAIRSPVSTEARPVTPSKGARKVRRARSARAWSSSIRATLKSVWACSKRAVAAAPVSCSAW